MNHPERYDMNDHVERSLWLIRSELSSLEKLFKDEGVVTNHLFYRRVGIKYELLKMKDSISKLEKEMKEDLDEEQ